MKEFPVLVQPLANEVDEHMTCWNCGSSVIRVLKKWAVLTDEGSKELGVSRVGLYGLEMICAACGESIEGYQLMDDCCVVEGLNDLSTEADAKECLEDMIINEEKEKQKGMVS